MSLEKKIKSQLKSFQWIQENVDINWEIERLNKKINSEEILKLEERKKEIKKELDKIFDKYPDLKIDIE